MSAKERVKNWNDKYPIGTSVIYYRDIEFNLLMGLVTKTRSIAYTICNERHTGILVTDEEQNDLEVGLDQLRPIK